jgi:hypothetical protein
MTLLGSIGVIGLHGRIGLIADGAGSPLDQGVTSMLLIAALFFAVVAFRRLRGKGFPRLPRPLAWGAASLSVACIVLAVVLPPILRPMPSSTRPHSTAHIAILSPTSGQVFRGAQVRVQVRLRLTGGRIVPFTSTNLIPNEGHIHVFVDGRIVSMTQSLDPRVWVVPGIHRLQAEFVAVDHLPFSPPVLASVVFRVVG